MKNKFKKKYLFILFLKNKTIANIISGTLKVNLQTISYYKK